MPEKYVQPPAETRAVEPTIKLVTVAKENSSLQRYQVYDKRDSLLGRPDTGL